jgi:hypothetical protein
MLAVTLAAASATVMLSGYATGGQLGLPLAGALAGGAIASLVMRGPDVVSWVGPAVVGLFALLTMGYWFADLTALHALMLFAAPLVCWVAELPYARRLGPKLRAAICLVLVVVLAGGAVLRAQRAFAADTNAIMGPNDDSEQDYMENGR